jgi:AcrR family transcriptional regulator
MLDRFPAPPIPCSPTSTDVQNEQSWTQMVSAADQIGPRPAPASRRLMRRAERRQALVAAATRAFARGGFAATSLDDIAAEAEVARDTIYRNFDSKTDLYRAALEAALQAVKDQFTQTGGGRPDPEGVDVLFAVARDNPDGFRLLFHHAAREPEFRPQLRSRPRALHQDRYAHHAHPAGAASCPRTPAACLRELAVAVGHT